MAYETDPEAVKAARAQHSKDKTGLLNTLYCSAPMGFFKNDAVVQSKEFAALDKEIREHLTKPTIPHFEIATVSSSPRLCKTEYRK